MRIFFAVVVAALCVHYVYLLINRSTAEQELLTQLRDVEKKLGPLEKQAKEAKILAQKLHQLTTDTSVDHVKKEDLAVAELGRPITLSKLREIEAQAIEVQLFNEKAELLAEELNKHVLSLSRLVDHFEQQKELRQLLPSIKPVDGTLSSPFGPRLDPYSGEAAMHAGVDFAAPEGTLVFAPAFGRVIFFASDGALGNLLIVDHGAGIHTQYGHLKAALVEVGAVVERGQAIAQVGNTGKSTGPHLHYEVRRLGIPVNPMQYIIN